jgi:nitrous oxidase accessory protein
VTSVDAGVTRRRVELRAGAVARASPATLERLVFGGLAALLLLASLALPLWQAELQAPQYPGGLRMEASGGEVTGDVAEINLLNHYVGMRPFEEDDIPELGLWVPAVLLGIGLVGMATVARHRVVRVLAKAGLCAIPVGVLADIQWRLWQYGHDLNPEAALRIDEFTPWVVGRTKVWNFNTLALPGLGLVAAVAAALLVTAGPPVARRIRGRLAGRSGRPVPAAPAVTALAAALVLAFAAPVAAESGSGHHHHPPAQDTTTVPAETDTSHDSHDGRGLPAPRSPLEVDAGTGGELQRRLAAASAGATVIVEPGTYQGPLVLDRPVTLIGRGRPVLDGGGRADVIVIRAPGTVVKGFHVRHGGQGPIGMPAGIRVEADNVTVEDVLADDVYAGIVVAGVARARILGNVIHGRGGALDDGGRSLHAEAAMGPGDGISLWNVKGAVVQDNEIHHARDGIYLSYGQDLFLDRNHVRDSRFGLHDMWARDLALSENRFEHNLAGAVLMYGGPVLALRNRITDHRSPATGFGFLVRDVADAHLAENVVARNAVGIQVEGAPLGDDPPTRLVLNTIAHNGVGLSAYATARVGAGGNSFAANTVQVLPQGRNALDGIAWQFEGTGNYWSDYRGYDAGGDGVGDVPHPIGGVVEGLFTRSPALSALAGSPALRLLRAVEERFLGDQPAALARGQLMAPHSPPLEPGGGSPRHTGALGLAGAALVALVALAAWRLRCHPRPASDVPIRGELAHVPAA